MGNLVDMDNEEILNKYFKDKIPEIIIDFSDNDKGKLYYWKNDFGLNELILYILKTLTNEPFKIFNNYFKNDFNYFWKKILLNNYASYLIVILWKKLFIYIVRNFYL